MSLSPFITHGNDGTTPLFLEADIERNAQGLDVGTLKYSCADRNHFAQNAQVGDARFAGLYVNKIKAKMDGPVWDIFLDVQGVAGPKAERFMDGYPIPLNSATDWDRLTIKMLTQNHNRFVQGTLVGGFGIAMACMTASGVPLDGFSGWYSFDASLMGIAQNKPGTRTIECSGTTIDGKQITWPVSDGGWTTPLSAQVTITGITVTDVDFQDTPPDTQNSPGSVTPPDSPALRNLGTLLISPAKRYWPAGWVYRPSGEQLMKGISLWKNTRTYTFQVGALPDGE